VQGNAPLHVHALFVHPSEIAGEHVFGQVTGCPQLFVVGPHALPLHAAVLSGVQHVLSAMHTPAFGQVAAHMTVWPQLLVAVLLHLPAQAVALSGVQQLSLTQTSEDETQLTVLPAPHATV
jgi:hypothetical protein